MHPAGPRLLKILFLAACGTSAVSGSYLIEEIVLGWFTSTCTTLPCKESPVLRLGTSLALDVRSDRNADAEVMIKAWTVFLDRLHRRDGGIKINGETFKLQIVIVDDSEGDSRVSNLVAAGVPLILGPWSEDLVSKVKAEITGDPSVVALTASYGSYSGISNVHSVKEDHMQKILKMMLQSIQGKASSMVVLVETGYEPYCASSASLASAVGITVVQQALPMAFDDADPSFKSAVSTAMGSGADAMLVCAGSSGVVSYVNVAKTINFSPKVTLLPAVELSDLSALLGDDAKWFIGQSCRPYTLAATTVDWRSNSSNLTTDITQAWFRQDYSSRFLMEPPEVASWAFAAAEMMLEAVKTANSTNASDVASALSNLKTQTVAGVIELGSDSLGEDTCLASQIQSEDQVPRLVYPEGVFKNAFFVYPAPAWSDTACVKDDPIHSSWGFDSGGNCIDCPDGQEARFFRDQQRRICTACEPGRTYYRKTASESFCQYICPTGEVDPTSDVKYQDDHETFEDWFYSSPPCKPCQNGTFKDFKSTGDDCALCQRGFTSSDDNSECLPCAPGKYSDQDGLPQCLPCEAGFFAATDNMVECGGCLQGRYSSEAGAISCTLCEPGKVAPDPGRTACDTCPKGRYSALWAVSCEDCPVGRYQEEEGQTECKKDMPGGSSVHTGQDAPHNEAGFYAYKKLVRASAENETGNDVYIVEMEACRDARESCLTNETCKAGSTGRQCRSCLPGYYFHRSTCEKCPPAHQTFTMMLAILLGACVIYQFAAIFIVSSARRFADSHPVLTKLLLNHLIQMAVLGNAATRSRLVQTLEKKYDFVGYFLNILNVFDGLVPEDSYWLSLSCFVQPISKVDKDLMQMLESSKHMDFFSAELAPAREALRLFQLEVVHRLVIIWNLAPIIAVAMSTLICFLAVSFLMLENHDLWFGAPDFYTRVYVFGWTSTRHMSAFGGDLAPRYAEAWYRRLWDIYWPITHASAWSRKRWIFPKLKLHKRTGLGWYIFKSVFGPAVDFFESMYYHRVNVKIFWRDSLPIRATVLHLIYPALAERMLRSLHCTSFGQQLGSEPNDDRVRFPMLYESELDCDRGYGIQYIAVTLSISWCVVVPGIGMYRLYRRRRNMYNPEVFSEFVVNLVGYKKTHWWWEGVIMLRKASLILISILPLSAGIRMFLYFSAALVSFSLQEKYKPYDERSGGILNIMERQQLMIFGYISVSFACAMSIQITESSFAKVFPMAPFVIVTSTVLSMLYTTSIVGLIFKSAVMSRVHALRNNPQNARKGRCAAMLDEFFLRFVANRERKQAYISFDHVHSYLTVMGSRGDKSVPIYIERGQYFTDRQVGRSLLTEVPILPVNWETDAVKKATQINKYQLYEMLLYTTQHIAASTNSFSCSLMDFVVRSAFLHAAEKRQVIDDMPQEVERTVWNHANKSRDLNLLRMKREQQEAGDLQDDQSDGSSLDAVEQNVNIMGRLMMKDMREHRKGLIDKWGEWPHYVQIRAKCLAEGREVTEEDIKNHDHNAEAHGHHHHFGGADDEDDAGDSSDEEDKSHKAVLPDLQADAEPRMRSRAVRMFSPGLFRQGLPLAEFEVVLTEIRQTDPAEIAIALDHFERMWLQEKIVEEKTLLKATGSVVEAEVQASSQTLDMSGKVLLLEDENEVIEEEEEEEETLPSREKSSTIHSDAVNIKWGYLLTRILLVEDSRSNFGALLKLRDERDRKRGKPKPKKKSGPAPAETASQPRSVHESNREASLDAAITAASSNAVEEAMEQFLMNEAVPEEPDKEALDAGVAMAISLGLDKFFAQRPDGAED